MILWLLLWSLVSLVVADQVGAVRSLEIVSSSLATLTPESVISVTASCSGFSPEETVLVKGVFYRPGSTNYLGFTQSGETWIKASAKTDTQRPVQLSSWDKTLLAKPDYTDSGFTGAGEYLFKIGYYYYTSSGSLSSVSWSTNYLTLNLTVPEVPTPTCSPIPSTIPASLTPSPRPPISTSVPMPSMSPTPPRPSPLPSLTLVPKIASVSSSFASPAITSSSSSIPTLVFPSPPPTLPIPDTLSPEVPQLFFSPGFLLAGIGAGMIILAWGLALRHPFF